MLASVNLETVGWRGHLDALAARWAMRSGSYERLVQALEERRAFSGRWGPMPLTMRR